MPGVWDERVFHEARFSAGVGADSFTCDEASASVVKNDILAACPQRQLFDIVNDLFGVTYILGFNGLHITDRCLPRSEKTHTKELESEPRATLVVGGFG